MGQLGAPNVKQDTQDQHPEMVELGLGYSRPNVVRKA